MKRHLQAGGLLVLAGSVCLASVDETISDCALLESKDARIACLEHALRRLDDGGDVASTAEAVVSETPQEPAPVDPAPVEEPPPPVEAVKAADAPPASAPEPGPADKADPPVAQLGSEQVEAHHRSKAEVATVLRATVVDFDFFGYRRLRVQLDNGQIWRQIDGDRTSVERELRNETSFDVELWGTGLGGYRMRIAELDRTLRVERLK